MQRQKKCREREGLAADIDKQLIDKPNHTRFQIFTLPHDQPGVYLGSVNRTLRVIEAAGGEERHRNALQYLIDQHPCSLLIIPAGEHKRSKCTSLAEIAPERVPSRRPKNGKKRQTLPTLQGTHFLKNAAPEIKGLQCAKTPFLQKSRSADA